MDRQCVRAGLLALFLSAGCASGRWYERGLVEQHGTLDGMAFTIKAPREPVVRLEGDQLNFDYYDGRDPWHAEFRLSIRVMPPPPAGQWDDRLRECPPGASTPRGCVYSIHNPFTRQPDRYLVIGLARAGDGKWLGCMAPVDRSMGDEDVRVLVEKVERMCASLAGR